MKDFILRILSCLIVVFITNPSINVKKINIPQECGMSSGISDEQALYNLMFTVACMRPDITDDNLLHILDNYGIQPNKTIHGYDFTYLYFSDCLSLRLENNPINHAYVVLEVNEAHIEIPIEFSYHNVQEYEQLMIRDFDPSRYLDSPIDRIRSKKWSALNITSQNQQDDFYSNLLLCFYEATAVYPGMIQKECLEFIQSDIFQSNIISNSETEIWISNELASHDMRLDISYFFYHNKLTSISIVLFPGEHRPSLIVQSSERNGHLFDIAPMMTIEIENTWICLDAK